MLFLERIENISKPIISVEIETVIQNLPINKSPGTYGKKGKCYQTFRAELALIFLKNFQ